MPKIKQAQLSIAEAIEQGFKYCTPEYDEMELIPISECEFNRPYVLVEKETKPYQISSDLILDLLDNYLGEQDEVADEDGKLNGIAAEIDYTDITKKLNDAFAAHTKYYHPTNIRLVKELNTVV